MHELFSFNFPLREYLFPTSPADPPSLPPHPPPPLPNDLSTALQLTNRLLRFWADGGFVYYKRVSSPSFSSRLNIVITTSWFAIALDEIRTRRILREKAHYKQSKLEYQLK